MNYPLPIDLLPHRPPQLYLTRVLAVADDHGSIETLAVLPAELFPGHFPGRPVLPGVAMIEMLAQSLACLASLTGEPGLGMLTGVEKARFRGVVTLPAECVVEVAVTARRFGLTMATGKVRCGGKVVCTASLQAVLVESDA